MNEYRLFYRSPATCFNEALPLGNGFLGAMIYGRTDWETIPLNCDTLWSGKPGTYLTDGAYEAYCNAQKAILNEDYDTAHALLAEQFANAYCAYYLSPGKLQIRYSDSDLSDYSRSLDIENGIASVSCASHTAEHLISYGARAMLSKLSLNKSMTVTIGLDPLLRGNYRNTEDTVIWEGQCPVAIETDRITDYGTEGTRFCIVLRARTDGVQTICDNEIVIRDATEIELYLTLESSYVNYADNQGTDYQKRALSLLQNAMQTGYEKIRSAHSKYYQTHMHKAELNLDTPAQRLDTVERLMENNKQADMVELLFNYGKYLTIAASSNGSHATNLQGIWCEQLIAPWHADYHTNINVEMNYWPTLMCNLPTFHHPMIDLIRTVSETGRLTARHYYHANGFVCHHNADIWGYTTPAGGIGREHDPLNPVYSFWSGASGWLCEHLFAHYEYTQDKDYLKETAYPIMRSAAEFYLDILIPVEDRMVICPATSPENFFIDKNGIRRSVSKWSAMSQSIVLGLFQNCIRCCEILQTDDAFRTKLQEIVPLLKPFSLNANGTLTEWDRDYTEFDPQHRHVSHLYGLYPANLITSDAEDQTVIAAMKKTLETRGDDGTGWALAWKACLWAKLKEGDHAWKLILRQLQYKPSHETKIAMKFGGGTYANLFDAHPPFQIDGNYGITAAIAMLFLQCEDEKVKLLPALPSGLDHGSIKGLLAKGNVTVDLFWDRGILTRAILCSPIQQTVTVRYRNFDLSVSLLPNQKTELSVSNFDPT